MAPSAPFAAIIGPGCQLCITHVPSAGVLQQVIIIIIIIIIIMQVFCSKCSDLRHPVPWEDGRKARICRSCHQVLTTQATSPTPVQELPVRPKGLLEVRDA